MVMGVVNTDNVDLALHLADITVSMNILNNKRPVCRKTEEKKEEHKKKKKSCFL